MHLSKWTYKLYKVQCGSSIPYYYFHNVPDKYSMDLGAPHVTPRFWNPNASGVVNLSEVTDKSLLSFHHNHTFKFGENSNLFNT